jgi:hypothetical protein
MPSYTDYQSLSATIGSSKSPTSKEARRTAASRWLLAKIKVTSQRLPATFTDQFIENPGLARSNLAESVDKLDGDQEWRDKVKEYVFILTLLSLPSF